MAAKRVSKGSYVCVVPKGKTRKGCGGGAKVAELESFVKKAVKRLDKRMSSAEAELEERARRDAMFEANSRAITASGKARAEKK